MNNKSQKIQQRAALLKQSFAVLNNITNNNVMRMKLSDAQIQAAQTIAFKRAMNLAGITDEMFSDYFDKLKWGESDPEMIELNQIIVSAGDMVDNQVNNLMKG